MAVRAHLGPELTITLAAVIGTLGAGCGGAPARIAPPWEAQRWVAVAGATMPQIELRSTLDDLEDFTRPLRQTNRDDDGQELQWVQVDRVEFGRTEVPAAPPRDPRAPAPAGPQLRVGRQLGSVRFAALSRGAAGLALVAFPAGYDRATARPRPGVREVRLERFLALVRQRAGRAPMRLLVLLDPKRYASVVHVWIVATDERHRALACAERSCVVMDVWFGGMRRAVEAQVALALEPGAALPSFARPAAPRRAASQPGSASASAPASRPTAP